MINLDLEEEGSFIIGCAGGKTTSITLPLSKESPLPDNDLFRLSVGGLQGGHSGVDIHKHRANANKILARALDRIMQNVPIQLVALNGGTARNAIAREAEVVFACPRDLVNVCHEDLVFYRQEVQRECSDSDGGLTLTLGSYEKEKDFMVIGLEGTQKIIRLLMALPHGVVHMSASIEGFVETSTNLAVLELKQEGLRITTLQRSTVMSRLDEIRSSHRSDCSIGWSRDQVLRKAIPPGSRI